MPETYEVLERLTNTETIDRAIKVLELANSATNADVRQVALWIIHQILEPTLIAKGEE